MSKISVSSLDKIIKENTETVHYVDFYGNTLEIKRVISLEEMAVFVDAVVRSCVLTDHKYQPEVKDFVIKSNLISAYTNIKLPEKVEKQYEVIYRIWDELEPNVIPYISECQYISILEAIDEKIDHALEMDIDAVNNSISETATLLNTISDVVNTITANINTEAVSSFLTSISEHGDSINEETLVKLIAKAVNKDNGDNITDGNI